MTTVISALLPSTAREKDGAAAAAEPGGVTGAGDSPQAEPVVPIRDDRGVPVIHRNRTTCVGATGSQMQRSARWCRVGTTVGLYFVGVAKHHQ